MLWTRCGSQGVSTWLRQSLTNNNQTVLAARPRICAAPALLHIRRYTESIISSSVDSKEVEQFGKVSSGWWDEQGPFKQLHKLNITRVAFMRNAIEESLQTDPRPARPLNGLRVLDVGCGGGLLSESLARLGATVTGVDATPEAINVARSHSQLDRDVASRVEYHQMTAEDLLEMPNLEKFDVVCGMEVIEHVSDPTLFLETLSQHVKDDGLMFLSTLNRTSQAFVFAIVAAEGILQMVPSGTHDWSKFVTPEEMCDMLHSLPQPMQVLSMVGTSFNPLLNRWEESNDRGINYMLVARRRPQN